MRHVRLLALPWLALAAACSSGGAASGGAGGGTSSGNGASGGAGGAGGAETPPEKPAALVAYLTGNDADADVVPAGPAVLLMGGGTDVDAAFQWWRPYLAGGDVIVLRTSGADGYNEYLYDYIGGCDSVETMIVDTPDLADDDYVTWRIRHAEGVFIAGGDQGTYVPAWKDHGVEDAIMAAYERGAVIGGTSAGCAVLGPFVFAAYNGSVYSDEALADPYNVFMTLDRDFLALPLLAGVITDSHFYERDRMGRLVGFMARILQDGWAGAALGVGVDERTALVVDPAGQGQVLGERAAYIVRSSGPPAVCQPGQPLDYSGLTVHKLLEGDAVTMPSGDTAVPGQTLAAQGGALSPANPY
jgi:cyanophycinase